MSDTKKAATCFSCKRSDTEVPLVQLRYSSKEIHICPQCLPALIHHFDTLAGKLPER